MCKLLPFSNEETVSQISSNEHINNMTMTIEYPS